MPATSATFTDYGSGGTATASSGGTADAEEDYSVATLRRQYIDFQSAKRAEIEEQRTARHYYHGDQLTKEQRETLRLRGQPATVRNKIDRKINGVVGLIERLRQDPKAFPRTPEHEEGAEIATAVVRYVLDASRWEVLSSEEARDGAVNGIFGIELRLEHGDQGDPDVALDLLAPDTL